MLRSLAFVKIIRFSWESLEQFAELMSRLVVETKNLEALKRDVLHNASATDCSLCLECWANLFEAKSIGS